MTTVHHLVTQVALIVWDNFRGAVHGLCTFPLRKIFKLLPHGRVGYGMGVHSI